MSERETVTEAEEAVARALAAHKMGLGDGSKLPDDLWQQALPEAHVALSAVAGERAALLTALHDAIRRPLGVTPDSALPFYDQRLADEAEQRRAAIRADKGGE